MSPHKQLPGVDIDAVHRTWPHQRGLFRGGRGYRVALLCAVFAAGYALRFFTGA